MFALSKKTDYAIIALSHMAQRPGEVCTAREIAEQFHVPVSLLMNVLKTMNQGELVRSVRGAKGGYALALPADEITLADIITSVEGPIRFVQCVSAADNSEPSCNLFESCPMVKPVQKVQDKLRAFLERVTLAQIAYDEDYGDPAPALSAGGAATQSE